MVSRKFNNWLLLLGKTFEPYANMEHFALARVYDKKKVLAADLEESEIRLIVQYEEVISVSCS